MPSAARLEANEHALIRIAKVPISDSTGLAPTMLSKQESAPPTFIRLESQAIYSVQGGPHFLNERVAFDPHPHRRESNLFGTNLSAVTPDPKLGYNSSTPQVISLLTRQYIPLHHTHTTQKI